MPEEIDINKLHPNILEFLECLIEINDHILDKKKGGGPDENG